MSGRSLAAGLMLTLAGAFLAACAGDASDVPDEPSPVARDRASLPEFQPFEAERSRHTATLLADGTVLIAGGRDTETGEAVSAAERYVSSSVGFRRLPELGLARYGHTATRLFDGTILIVGGFGKNDAALSSAELFSPVSDEFETLDQGLLEVRGEHTATLLPDGRVLLLGGASRADLETPAHTAEIYDPVERAFHRTTAAPRAPGARNVAVSLLDGKVLVAWTASGTEEIFEPASGRFSAARAPLDFPESFGSVVGAARLPDGSLAVSGTENFARVGDALHCEDHETVCDGRCTDLQSGWPSGECGSCGVHCGPFQDCVEGSCACPDRYTTCGADCVDLSHESKHCGSCGHACAEGEFCADGQCSCPGTICGSECVNIAWNAENCGGCGQACATGLGCVSGVCGQCIFPQVRCGALCFNLSSDPKNCGACGHACETNDNYACQGGVCVLEPCAYGEQRCQSLELECHGVFDDPENCGQCGTVCPEGATCQAGVCALAPSSEPTTGPSWTLTRAAGSLLVTSRSLAKSFGETDGPAWNAGVPSGLIGESSTDPAFGGPGHTATALPDGSVLVVGGEGTPSARRLHPHWSSADIPGYEMIGPPTTAAIQTGLLPNGHLIILNGHRVYDFDGRNVTTVADLPVANTERWQPLGVVPQPNGEVLLVSATFQGSPAARLSLYDPATSAVRTLDLEVNAAAQALPLSDGAVLIGDTTNLVLVRRSSESGELGAETVPVDFSCDPRFARLPNGRVLVVENETIHELDPQTLDLSDVGHPSLPRCYASIVVQPSGAALLIGGESTTGRGSPTAELYEPGSGTTRTVDIGLNTVATYWRPLYWFDEPIALPGSSEPPVRLDWQSLAFYNLDLDTYFSDIAAFSLLPDASFLALQDTFDAPFIKRYWPGSSRRQVPFSYPDPQSIRMNDVVDFDERFPGHPFPGAAPEGSTGATASSPTNLPVAVWFPAQGGWPVMGTLTKSDGATSYRVPRTPFPGLGFLFLSTGGELDGVGPLTIEPSPDGNGCSDAGECDSGFCVDGVCCESACEGACEACSRAAKGTGDDGVCGAVKAGVLDDQCEMEAPSTCGYNGTCDGRRHCAKYPDQTVCGPGDLCAAGKCVMTPSMPPSGDGGAGGEGGEPSVPEPKDACDGNTNKLITAQRVQVDCAPYRCPDGADRCETSCESNRDCTGGNVCASGRCRASLDVSRIEGCGCRVPGRAQPGGFSALGFLAALTLLGRRHRRATIMRST